MIKHKIIIAGAGFGGVRAALKLARNDSCEVTVVSDRDTFRYYPALYATATGHTHEESLIKLSEIFAGTNVTFVKDTLKGLEPGRKKLIGKKGTYRYDSLILALGTVTNYFGIKGLSEYSFGIKSEHEVNTLKSHLHENLTEAKKLDPNYVVIGAGPTGVELAASLRSYIQEISYSHHLRQHSARVDLIEAVDRVLPRMSPKASALVEKRLKSLGITMMLNSKVEGETADDLTVNGKHIPTHTVIWTSGVANNPFFTKHTDCFPLAPNGKVQVDAFLQGRPSVYVIGDNALTPFSGLAQTALYDADFVARNIQRQLSHLKPRKYKPRRPPVVVPVGKDWAIFEYGKLTFGGRLGSWVRRAADLIGYMDILPFSKAIKIWRSAENLEETCPICKQQLAAREEEAREAHQRI